MHGASLQCNIVPVARQTATANRAPETLRAEPRAAREKQPKARRNSRARRGMSRARRSESSVAIAHCDRWRQGCAGFMECCSAAELGPIAKRDRDEASALSRSTLWATYDSSRLLLSGLMCSADTAATDQAGTKRGSSRALLISSTCHVLTVSVVCSTN